jgi:hypothetical protein
MSLKVHAVSVEQGWSLSGTCPFNRLMGCLPDLFDIETIHLNIMSAQPAYSFPHITSGRSPGFGGDSPAIIFAYKKNWQIPNSRQVYGFH